MICSQFSEIAPGFRHQELETCESTNLICLEAARSGEPGNLWVTAIYQTAGKGSRGRSWSSLPGNLFASLLLIDPSNQSHLPELTFVAALAVHDAISGYLPGADVRLKWPNDVLVRGRKISGILLESTDYSNRKAVVVGIGINCTEHPEGTAFPATDISAEGHNVDRMQLFYNLSFFMASRLSQWASGQGFESIRNDWLHKAWGVGEKVDIVLHNQELMSGVFVGLTQNGQMELSNHDGSIKAISVGDVFPATRSQLEE